MGLKILKLKMTTVVAKQESTDKLPGKRKAASKGRRPISSVLRLAFSELCNTELMILCVILFMMFIGCIIMYYYIASSLEAKLSELSEMPVLPDDISSNAKQGDL